MAGVEYLPFEIWEMILLWVNVNELLELRRVNRYYQGIIRGIINNAKGKFRQETEEIKGKLPNQIFWLVKRTDIWEKTATKEGKVMLMWKCLKWVHSGPQGPYKPYWYYVNTRLPTFSDLRGLHGITRDEYEAFLKEKWGEVKSEERRFLKYESRLKNVIECIEGKGGKGSLSGRRAKIRQQILQNETRGEREIVMG